MSSSKPRTACAPCKNMHRKCDNNCVFAHHFPPHQLYEFESLQRVYGVSNVERILRDLPIKKREAAIKSLVYEAEALIKDPVYGCLGTVSILEKRLKQVQTELNMAKQELATHTRQYWNQQPVNKPFDGAPREQDLLSKMKTGAGPSGQATQPRHLTTPRAMSPSLALGGSYESHVGQFPLQQALYHHMQQLITDQPMPQQQEKPSESQPQSQPNQGDGSADKRSVELSD